MPKNPGETTPSERPEIVNLPESVHGRKLLTSNPIGALPLYTEQFPDGSGFTFDAENPRGVSYLTREKFAACQATAESDEVAQTTAASLLHPALPGKADRGRRANSNPSSPRRFSVWLHISNACNLACRYCYIPHLKKAVDSQSMAGHFMSASTIEIATKALFEFCVDKGYGELHVKFAGGEPTLDVDRIEATCNFAHRMSMHYKVAVSFSILTNGVFADRRILMTLRRHRISTSISVDGAPSAHDRIRFTIRRNRSPSDPETGRTAREGTWTRIHANIEDLIGHGVRPFLLCTVTKVNYSSLMEFADYAVSNKLGFRLSLVRDGSTYRDVEFRGLLLVKLIEVYEWLGNNMPTSMPIERYGRFAEWLPSTKKNAVCAACKSSVALNQDGDIASCQMRMDKPFGNVNRESLANAFSKIQTSEDNRYMVAPSTRTGDCSRCYWKYVCAGGCPEHSRLALSTLNAPSPWCEVYRNLLPHYLRAIAIQAKRRMEG